MGVAQGSGPSMDPERLEGRRPSRLSDAAPFVRVSSIAQIGSEIARVAAGEGARFRCRDLVIGQHRSCRCGGTATGLHSSTMLRRTPRIHAPGTPRQMGDQPRSGRRLLALWAGILVLSGCDDSPRDPNRTLERVRASQKLRVVAVDHQPWVIASQGSVPAGVEAELVQAFADELGVAVEWRQAPAFEVLEAIERGDADLAVGGFTAPGLEAEGSATRTFAYFTEELVVAVEPGAPVPDELSGQRVFVPPDPTAASLVEQKDGAPVREPDDDIRLVVMPQWQVLDHGLEATPITLRRDEHVWAVPKGKNAWIMRLETFLRDEADGVGGRLRGLGP